MKIMLLLGFLSFAFTLSIKGQDVNHSKKIKTSQEIEIEGNTIKLPLGIIELDRNGFPKQVQTIYNQSKTPTVLLFENIHFHFVRKIDGKNINLKNSGVEFLNVNNGSVRKNNVSWKATSENDSLRLDVVGAVNNAGLVSYRVKVTALQTVSLKDVTMHIPFIKTVPTSMMGFGVAEGDRPEKVEWKWDGPFKKQNGAWLGNQDTGIKYILDKGDWNNKGKGGVIVGIKGGSMLANNYTGEHEMIKGEVKYYNFQLIIKPLQSIKK